MSASQNGHKEIVELLIEKGAEVDRTEIRRMDGSYVGKPKRTQGHSWSYLLKRVPG